MRFWDSSALVPLCIDEPATVEVRGALDADPAMVAWWGSPVECMSALARRRREGALDRDGERDARARLEELRRSWVEIVPSEELRREAAALLLRHPLRAGDVLQLAAAKTCFPAARPGEIVTLDDRLREAAIQEGLVPIP